MDVVSYAKGAKNGAQIATFAQQIKASGSDDTAAIQAALTNFDTVFLPDENYTISDTLLVPSKRKLYGVFGKTKITLAANTNKPLISNSDFVNGNTGIVLMDLWLDGNKENQTIAFSCVDFRKVTHCIFENLKIRGALRTGVFGVDESAFGEGLMLIDSDYNEIRGGYYYENCYDGVKLRACSYNRISNICCEDNGRAGIQLCYGYLDTVDKKSNYNVVENVVVKHKDGIPCPSSPTTSGVYIHKGDFNTFTNINVYGTRQGIGLIEEAYDNVLMNGTIRTRYSDKAALDVEGKPACLSARNTFSNFVVRSLSGGNGTYIRTGSGCAYNRFFNNYFTVEDLSETWTINLESGGSYTQIINNTFPSTGVTLTDNQSNTRIKMNLYLADN